MAPTIGTLIVLLLGIAGTEATQGGPIEGISVYSEDTSYDANRFPAEYVLTKLLEGSMTQRDYWLLPSGVVDEGFVLDMGTVYDLSSIILWNTKNTNYNDRGTENFELNLSIDAEDWTTIGDGTLTDVRNLVQTPDDFAFSGRGRYLQFIVKSYYGSGAGLQFIEVFGEPAPTDCFEYDTDFMGADLNNGATTGVASAAECQTLCLNRNGCTHFTWVSPSFDRAPGIRLKCHLKNGMGERMVLDTGRADATGLVSGPANCGGDIVEVVGDA